MTSKSSFLIDCLENARRRAWVYMLVVGAWWAMLPVFSLLEISRIRSMMNNGDMDEGYRAYMMQQLKNSYASGMSFSGFLPVLTALLAVVMAVQGFSWLNSQRKMDLYMSVPVPARRRYLVNWCGAVTVFSVSYLVNLVLNWILGACFGILSPAMMGQSLLAFVMLLLVFVGAYAIASIGVMLTGNTIAAVTASLVLFFYEPAVRVLAESLKAFLYAAYSNAALQIERGRMYLMPVANYMAFLSRFTRQVNGIYKMRGSFAAAYAVELLMLIVIDGVLVCLSYFLYRKRKTESYNKTIAFGKIKPFLEVLLLVPASCGMACMTGNYANDKNAVFFLTCVITAIVGHVLIRLSFEQDLREIRKGILPAAAALVISVGILSVFRFDLAGYDSYLPAEDKIASVSVSYEYDYSNFGTCDPDLRDMNYGGGMAKDVILKNMNSDHPETIRAVRSLVQKWQQAGYPLQEGNIAARVDLKRSAMDAANGQYWVVKYKLTSGREVYRRFMITEETAAQELAIISSDPAYQYNRYEINRPIFDTYIEDMRCDYGDGKKTYAYSGDMKALLDAYRQDFASYDYTVAVKSDPVGNLSFSIHLPADDTRGYEEYLSWNYPVYEDYAATIAVLESNGIVAGREGFYYKASDLTAIQISSEQYEDSVGIFGEDGKHHYSAITITEPEEIEEVLGALYPYPFDGVLDYDLHNTEWDYNYSITFRLTDESILKRYTETGGNVYKDAMPDWVIERLLENEMVDDNDAEILEPIAVNRATER